ncbi:MAG: tetratricopeptide repeat protein [Planctomycetes bacterium]|nr:tetratricopeptide repeat protein [Planctomycetota bacterium]
MEHTSAFLRFPTLRVLALAVLALSVGCSRPGARLELPLPEDVTGVDRMVLERVEAAAAAFARGESAAALELALVYEANSLNALAVRTYEVCLTLPLPVAEVQFHRGRTLAEMGQAQASSAAFGAAQAADRSYVPAFWRDGQVLLEAGEVQRARAQFEHAIALESDNVAARIGLARVQLVLDDPQGALRTLASVVERQPEERFVHGLLARAHQALGDEARAAEELEAEKSAKHVSMADPLTAEMRKRATGIIPAVRRANEALADGRSAEALEVLEPVYARDADKLAIVQTYGKALLEAGQAARAQTVLEQGLKLHADDYKLELLLGLALLHQEHNQPALAHLTRARELNPAYGPTHLHLGKLLTKMGRLAEAEESLLRALDSEDAELKTFLELGQVQLGRAAFARAVATSTRACARYPRSAAPWLQLAEAEARGGDADAARAALATAESLKASAARLESVRRLLSEGSASRR